MAKAQKTYTQEFKREAVRLACRSSAPIAQVARELGISDTSIYQWRKALATHGDDAFPGSGHQTEFHCKDAMELLNQTQLDEKNWAFQERSARIKYPGPFVVVFESFAWRGAVVPALHE
jgi:transposase-like protein